MEKTDLTKLYKNYYTAKPIPELVNLEEAQYASITGKGDPSGMEYSENVQALYTTVYTVKFAAKANGHDFKVPKLEAQWWFDEERYAGLTIEEAPVQIPRNEWYYRLLIRLPVTISVNKLEAARELAFEKKKFEAIKCIEFYTIPAGKALQMLHVGSFDREPETLMQMRDFFEKHPLQRNGAHHEIYLSDVRKTAPQKLKTILREPVK